MTDSDQKPPFDSKEVNRREFLYLARDLSAGAAAGGAIAAVNEAQANNQQKNRNALAIAGRVIKSMGIGAVVAGSALLAHRIMQRNNNMPQSMSNPQIDTPDEIGKETERLRKLRQQELRENDKPREI